MSKLYSEVDLDFEKGKQTIVYAQDVEEITDECAKQRLLDAQQGKEGLGIRTASIPVIEIQKAKVLGVDLMDAKQREEWLKVNPQYRTYENKGRSGQIIIK